MSNSPFNKRIVATNVQGVPVSTGSGVETCIVAIKRPMPCIVILVHGVNDMGEAYQNQEKGIIDGLKKRLGRDDLSPHEWHQFKMDMGDGEQLQVKKAGRSPVIPFYWGYKPVDHATYIEDQRRYRAEVDKLGNGAKLPYDAYQEDDKAKLEKLGHIKETTLKFTNDNFGNTLDDVYAKNGGTFANATTTIPDMLGPGAGGLAMGAAGFLSLHANGGDYTHPIYENPHRIYQFFAAQRLADLILTIKTEPMTKNDTINIVAHSQGTIISMLANMLVKQAGFEPVDCVILNHSPYALENTAGETVTDGHHQTNRARQETFINFCNLMKTNPRFNDGLHSEAEREELEGAVCIGINSDWKSNKLYRRNNFGKVYNYFCPNDGIVSLLNVQGFGWRGIPHEIAKDLINLKQRVFCENGPAIGNSPLSTPFEMPELKKGAFVQDTFQTKEYTFRDVVINGEQLPETFQHVLQGSGNQYHYTINPESPDQYISFSAKAKEGANKQVISSQADSLI
uniref:T6SS effector phospholipase Tle3 domain-containing protein n=1 Tax=Atlantibacter sp. TaxID=1903473 RepID=UPI0028B0C405